jgi:hypothetical protein
MIGALKAELNRIRTAKLEAAEDLAHCVEPMDSIAFRQRQVDAVAARLRGDGGRWTRRRRGGDGPTPSGKVRPDEPSWFEERPFADGAQPDEE